MGKTIVLFPEAAFGPALNCVGIAQQLRKDGHNPVFVCDRGFKGVFEKYGFEENLVDMSGGMSDEEIAKFWANFIAGEEAALQALADRSAADLRHPGVGGDRRFRDHRRGRAERAPAAHQAGPGRGRQRDPVPGDQARRLPVGAHHLLLGERDPRSRHPAAPVGLPRERQGRVQGVRRPVPGAGEADPRALQRVPGQGRPRALSAGPVLRSLAGDEPAALSEAAGLQAPPSAEPEAVPVSGRLRARRGRLPGAAVQEQQRQAADLCQLWLARRRRRRALPAHDRACSPGCRTAS